MPIIFNIQWTETIPFQNDLQSFSWILNSPELLVVQSSSKGQIVVLKNLFTISVFEGNKAKKTKKEFWYIARHLRSFFIAWSLLPWCFFQTTPDFRNHALPFSHFIVWWKKSVVFQNVIVEIQKNKFSSSVLRSVELQGGGGNKRTLRFLRSYCEQRWTQMKMRFLGIRGNNCTRWNESIYTIRWWTQSVVTLDSHLEFGWTSAIMWRSSGDSYCPVAWIWNTAELLNLWGALIRNTTDISFRRVLKSSRRPFPHAIKWAF